MFAVINLGLKSIRVALVDDRAEICGKKSLPISTVIHGERVEQDAEAWWVQMRELFHLLAKDGHVLGDITGLTVSGSSSCLACVNGGGQALGPVIMVSDRRHAALCRDPRFAALPVMLQRIEWVRRAQPETFAATAHFCAPNDFFIHRLTGVPVTDELNAGKMGLAAGEGEGVATELDESISRRLPQVRPLGDCVGTLRPQIAKELGLRAEVAVHLATYDALVATIGSGAVEDGMLSDVSGTVTSVRLCTQERLPRTPDGLFTQRLTLLDKFLCGGSNNMGGSLVEWLRQCFYQSEAAQYQLLEAEASEVRERDNDLVFLPYLMGERAPIWDASARGVFFGLERTHGRKHLVLAALEGIAFSARGIMEQIVAGGGRFRAVRLSGGLSRLDVVNKLKADIYGVPVEVVSEFESTVVGAFLVVEAARSGSAAERVRRIGSLVRLREVIYPDEKRRAYYERKYRLFQEVYRALAPVFKSAAEHRTAMTRSEDAYLQNL